MPRKNEHKNHQKSKGKGKKKAGKNPSYGKLYWDQDSPSGDDNDSFYLPYKGINRKNIQSQTSKGFDFFNFEDDLED